MVFVDIAREASDRCGKPLLIPDCLSFNSNLLPSLLLLCVGWTKWPKHTIKSPLHYLCLFLVCLTIWNPGAGADQYELFLVSSLKSNRQPHVFSTNARPLVLVQGWSSTPVVICCFHLLCHLQPKVYSLRLQWITPLMKCLVMFQAPLHSTGVFHWGGPL